MKKTVSFCIAVVMLLSTLFTANAVQTKKEASEYTEDYNTFYFLAPRTEEVNYFALNDDIGYWFWPGEIPGNVSWPGPTADKAPEIGKDVYKVNIPDTATGLIFNAYVNAYEDNSYDTLDLYKAPFAFQTKNIEDIEVWGSQDHRNEIYVLDLSTTYGDYQPITAGKWFSTDSASDNYYRLSDWYKAYNIKNDTDTPDSPQPSVPDNTNKTYSAGDTVTITYSVHDISSFGSVNSVLTYNTDVLETDSNDEGIWFEKNDDSSQIAVNNTNDEIKIGMVTYDPEHGSNYTDETDIVTFRFKAKTDFNEKDLGISLYTKRFMKIINYDTADLTDFADSYISVTVNLPEIADTNTDTETDLTTDTDTNTETDLTTDTDTNTETNLTTDTDTNTETDLTTDTDTNTETDLTTDTDTNTETDLTTDTDPLPSEPVKKLKVGDVDDDGSISSADALLVLRYSVKLETFSDEQIEAADVNKDNAVNSADALFVLRKSVKLTDNGTYFDD